MANEGIQYEIYAFSDPKATSPKWIVPGMQQPTFLDELGGNGGGSLSVALNDPQYRADPSMLDSRNLCRVKVDGTYVGAFLLGQMESVIVDDGERKTQGFKSIGLGLKTWFDDADVYPYGGLKPESGDNRHFNFATERGSWYVDADWKTPYFYGNVITGGHASWSINKAPQKWPENARHAKWFGASPLMDTMPYDPYYIRWEFTAVQAGLYAFYLAVDDQFILYLDGEEISKSSEKNSAWLEASRIEMTLSQGVHTIGIVAQNRNAPNFFGPTGVAFTLQQVGYDGAERYIGVSDGRDGVLKVLPYTLTVPGWTAGAVLNSLLNEAQARGILFPNYLTRTFTDTVDSNGKPWPDKLPWKFSVGQSYTAVLSAIEEFYDVWIDENLNLNVAATRGKDLTAGGEYTAWVERAKNLFPNPAAVNLSSFGGGSLGTRSTVTDFPGDINTAYRWTRTTASTAARVMDANVGLNFPRGTGVIITISGRIRTNFAGSVVITARPSTGSSTGAVTLGTVTISADQVGQAVDFSFTGASFTAAATSTSGIVATQTGSALNTTVDITGLTVQEGSVSNGPLHGGQITNNDLVRTRWVGATNASESVLETRELTAAAQDNPPVVLKLGKHLRSATTTTRGKIKNALVMKTLDGWIDRADSSSVNKYGRIEGSMDTNAPTALSEMMASRIFAQKASEEEGATYDIVATDLIPWKHFKVGDWVLAPTRLLENVKRRVMSISLERDEAGRPQYTIEFDTIFRDNEERMNKILDKLGGSGVGGSSGTASGIVPGGAGGGVTLPPINTPVVREPKAPTDLSATSTGYWSPNGVTPYSRVNLDWSDVTQFTDNSQMTALRYEVEGRLTSTPDGWIALGNFASSDAEMLELSPGVEWAFRVYAVSQDLVRSMPSAEIRVTPSGPNSPMLAPSKPSLESRLNQVIVTWDGKLNNNDVPPLQFRYVYAEVQQVTNGPWARMGYSMNRENRQTQIAGLTSGSTIAVRLVAVDGLGIASPVSASASIKVSGIEVGDIPKEIDDAIKKAQGDATNAGTAASNAQSAADIAAARAAAVMASAENKIADPSVSLGQWVAAGGWALSNFGRTDTFSVVAVGNGSTNAKTITVLSAPGSNTAQPLPVEPGQVIEYGGWYYVNDAYDGTSDNAKLRLANQSAALLDSLSIPNSPTRNTWVRLVRRITIPTSGSVTALTLNLVANNANGNAWWDDFWLKDVTAVVKAEADAENARQLAVAAQTAAGNAQSTANTAVTSASGRNAMYHDTTGPSGVGTRTGDIWHQWTTMAVNGKLIGTWRWSGTAWVKTALDETYIPQLNIGTGTYGSLDGVRLTAKTVSTKSLIVGDFTNLVEDEDFEAEIGLAWRRRSGATTASNYAVTTGLPGKSWKLDGVSTEVSVEMVNTFPVDPGQQYRVNARAQVQLAGSTPMAYIRVYWYKQDGTASATAFSQLSIPPTGWADLTAIFTAPTDGFYGRMILIHGNNNTSGSWWIGRISMRRMNGGDLIIDGSLLARHAKVDDFWASQAWIDAATINVLRAGIIEVSMVSSTFADDLVLTGNKAVTTIVNVQNDQAALISAAQSSADQANGVAASASQSAIEAQNAATTASGQAQVAQATADDAVAQVGVLQTWFRVDQYGAHVGQTGSIFQTHILPNQFNITENDVVTTYWEAGRMVVPSLVADTAIIANAQFEPFQGGLVIRLG